jgi:hypothetical protein
LIVVASTSAIAHRLAVQAALRNARAWFRVSSSTWIILTVHPVQHWYASLHPLLPAPARLLIVPAEMGELEATDPTFLDWLARCVGRL